jgi:hypothetical protein
MSHCIPPLKTRDASHPEMYTLMKIRVYAQMCRKSKAVVSSHRHGDSNALVIQVLNQEYRSLTF